MSATDFLPARCVTMVAGIIVNILVVDMTAAPALGVTTPTGAHGHLISHIIAPPPIATTTTATEHLLLFRGLDVLSGLLVGYPALAVDYTQPRLLALYAVVPQGDVDLVYKVHIWVYTCG